MSYRCGTHVCQILLDNRVIGTCVIMLVRPSPVVLSPDQHLTDVKREYHARPRQGENIAYIAIDRMGQYTIITQRLPMLKDYINAHASGPHETVSNNALYKALGREGGRAGELVKGRWCIRVVALDKASEMFEQMRDKAATAVVAAVEPAAYHIT